MGSIELSSGLASRTVNKFMMFNQTGISTAGDQNISARGMMISHGQIAGQVGARFAIMQGTVPTDFSALTSFNVRSSDLLVMFDASPGTSGGMNNFTGSSDTTNPAVLSTTNVNAVASGTATWFWWFTSPLANTNAWDNAATPYNQIIGTVGVVDSGADLILNSTSITTGKPYRIVNYKFQIPEAWYFS